MLDLDEKALLELVYGGAVLGAGGGGSIAAGLQAGRLALSEGKPRLARLKDLPPDARIVTFSRVGTVNSVDSLEGLDLEALRLFQQAEPRPIGGYIASEVGPLAVTYGWRASARSGIPVVDAPCNGRAHPLGLMGSLGLHRMPEHETTTAAAGPRGNLVLRTNVVKAARAVRRAAARQKAGVAVVRNPLPSRYVGRHAATGGLGFARRVGAAWLRHRKRGLRAILPALAALMQGRVLARGFIKTAELMEKDGFSIGHLAIRTDAGRQLLMPVCNEFMMALDAGRSLAAFPDLITVFDEESGLPLGSAEARVPQAVAVFSVPHTRLPLGSPMHDRTLLEGVERLLNLRFRAAA
jgi:hypothetical protein